MNLSAKRASQTERNILAAELLVNGGLTNVPLGEAESIVVFLSVFLEATPKRMPCLKQNKYTHTSILNFASYKAWAKLLFLCGRTHRIQARAYPFRTVTFWRVAFAAQVKRLMALHFGLSHPKASWLRKAWPVAFFATWWLVPIKGALIGDGCKVGRSI